jgi:hypothetical protein
MPAGKQLQIKVFFLGWCSKSDTGVRKLVEMVKLVELVELVEVVKMVEGPTGYIERP